MTNPLKCGVIGAGVFGGYHANQYAKLPGAVLAAVFDPHIERALALAGPHGALAFAEMEPFLAAVDAVSVTSPATTHAPAALAALRAGKAAYVEKPIAVTMEEADAIVRTARASGLVLGVGHQERLVFRAMGLFDIPEPPLRIEAIRRGTFSPRNLDVSCVLDLMIHDLDLALALSKQSPIDVEATGVAPKGPFADEVKAEVIFDDGLVGLFQASRVAAERERRMLLVFPSGEVEIDFLARSFRNTTPFKLDPHFNETPVGRDPLGAALGAFVAAASGGADHLSAEAEEGARAVGLALLVEDAMNEAL
jgi:predicted dehydrogenase